MSKNTVVSAGPGEFRAMSKQETAKRHEIAAKRNFMNTYRIEFKNSVVEDVGCKARVVVAHRVEAWTNDYAFFGHPTKLGEVTGLIPRSLVACVDLWVYSDGLGIGEGSNVPLGMSNAVTYE